MTLRRLSSARVMLPPEGRSPAPNPNCTGRQRNGGFPGVAAARLMLPLDGDCTGHSKWLETADCCGPFDTPSYRRLAVQAAAPSDVQICAE